MEEEDNVIDEDKNCVIVDGCHFCCSPFEAFQDDLTADEILAQAQDAAKEAREELTLRKPNSKVWWEFAVPKYIFSRGYCTKPISSILLFSCFFTVIKTLVTYWISHSYLTGVTAAQLRWHPSNRKVIENHKESCDCALFSVWTCVESMCHLFIHCLMIVTSGDFHS